MIFHIFKNVLDTYSIEDESFLKFHKRVPSTTSLIHDLQNSSKTLLENALIA